MLISTLKQKTPLVVRIKTNKRQTRIKYSCSPRARQKTTKVEPKKIETSNKPKLEPMYQTTNIRSSLKHPRQIENLYDYDCAICNFDFSVEDPVPLSCGHYAHVHCIMSYRKYTKNCPICKKPYKIIDYETATSIKNQSAIKIQKVWRGFTTRKNIKDFAPIGTQLRKRWVLSRAGNTSDRLATAIDTQNDAVEAILVSIEKELDWARTVMRAVEVKEEKFDWSFVRSRALLHDQLICTICLQTISKKECMITSCGHSFHNDCLQKWIQHCFDSKVGLTCPECRSAFQYRSLVEHTE